MNDRICTADINLKDHKAKIISVYAHTLKTSEENPELREDFYETIESIIDKTPKRDVIILAGDFNAKTGGGWNDFKDNMGKYGKGLINNSGRRLLEMCKNKNLYITNTTFKHKKSHITTWTAPHRNFKTWNGEERRNPVRNQIDYIIMGNEHMRFVKDFRSYGGIETDTDHKFVKTEVNFEWYKLKNNNEKSQPKIDIKDS